METAGVTIDGVTKEYPRIAGISSFGAGGANAHVVIEEYIPQDMAEPQMTITPRNPAIIVLSAKNGERLKEQARRILTAIKEQEFSDANLTDLAYTLQVGREAMEERIGLIAGSLQELEEKLEGFVDGRDGIENLYQGQVKRNQATLAVLATDDDMQETIANWIQRKKYGKLLDLWVKGLTFDWNKLYGEIKPCRISLPTYPFARERYWLPEIGLKSGNITVNTAMTASIHPPCCIRTPLICRNNGSVPPLRPGIFLCAHVRDGSCRERPTDFTRSGLSGDGKAAVEQAAGVVEDGRGIRLKNVVWVRPITVGEQPVRVHTGLFPEDNGEISYEIYSETEAAVEPVVHSQGHAILVPESKTLTLDLKAIQAHCSQRTLSAAEVYEAFKAMGIDYGPGHRGIEAVYVAPEQILAKLKLPAALSGTEDQLVLHPSMMDSALQASIGFSLGTGDTNPGGGKAGLKPFLPFTLEELEILGKCTFQYVGLDSAQ